MCLLPILTHIAWLVCRVYGRACAPVAPEDFPRGTLTLKKGQLPPQGASVAVQKVDSRSGSRLLNFCLRFVTWMNKTSWAMSCIKSLDVSCFGMLYNPVVWLSRTNPFSSSTWPTVWFGLWSTLNWFMVQWLLFYLFSTVHVVFESNRDDNVSNSTVKPVSLILYIHILWLGIP